MKLKTLISLAILGVCVAGAYLNQDHKDVHDIFVVLGMLWVISAGISIIHEMTRKI